MVDVFQLNSNPTYFQAVNYSENFLKLDTLINNLEEQTDIIKDVDSWHREYKVNIFSHNYFQTFSLYFRKNGNKTPI